MKFSTFFFFSSRRRHTRFKCDWSSDVCSSDLLRRHTLLHSDTLPGVWGEWLRLAGVPDLEPAHALTFEHFYLSIQAAIDELGIAMGPSALIAEDLEQGKLVAPFPDLALPARSYYWYRPTGRPPDPVVDAFCSWLHEVGGGAATVSSPPRGEEGPIA